MDKFNLIVPSGSMKSRSIELLNKLGEYPLRENLIFPGSYATNNYLIRRIDFQKPQEIPWMIDEGFGDVGLVGEDWLKESGRDLKIWTTFPISRASNQPVRLVLAVAQYYETSYSGLIPKYSSVENLPKGCVVATEYPRLAYQFLSERGRSDVRILKSEGQTEEKVNFGAQAIVDITETGKSLERMQLAIIDVFMQSGLAVVSREGNGNEYLFESFIRDVQKASF